MRVKLKAILWLHTIRLWRYRMGFLNMVLSEVLWILLLMMGMSLFVPPEHLTTILRAGYWTIAAWSIISSFSLLIGGWTTFFIMIGMVEEHMLKNTSPFATILGRALTGTTISFTIIIALGYLFEWIFGKKLMILVRPVILLIAFTLIVVESLSYSLSVSATSMRTSVSEQFLEILNFGIIGLLVVPVSALPSYARFIYLLTPYVAPTYLIKVAVGAEASSLIPIAIEVGVVESFIMSIITLRLVKSVETHVRRNGVRAVGFW